MKHEFLCYSTLYLGDSANTVLEKVSLNSRHCFWRFQEIIQRAQKATLPICKRRKIEKVVSNIYHSRQNVIKDCIELHKFSWNCNEILCRTPAFSLAHLTIMWNPPRKRFNSNHRKIKTHLSEERLTLSLGGRLACKLAGGGVQHSTSKLFVKTPPTSSKISLQVYKLTSFSFRNNYIHLPVLLLPKVIPGNFPGNNVIMTSRRRILMNISGKFSFSNAIAL